MQQGWANAQAVRIGRLHERKPEMHVRWRSAEHELDVGDSQLGACLYKCMQTTGDDRRRTRSKQVSSYHAGGYGAAAHEVAERSGVGPRPHQHDRQMILQVVA